MVLEDMSQFTDVFMFENINVENQKVVESPLLMMLQNPPRRALVFLLGKSRLANEEAR